MEKCIELKKGIKLHFIPTDLYKTNLNCIILTTPLTRENVTKNALIPFMLKRGTSNYKNQYILNEKLDEMYGAAFNCGIDKVGDNAILKFYMETIESKYTLKNENLLKENLEMLIEIVFNPLKINGIFNEEFLELEKENLKKVIESKIDSKDAYAFNQCISKMYGDEGFGLYKFGYIEDLENITIENLTNYYDWLVQNAKIDIFVSGEFVESDIKEIVFKNIDYLKEREENYILDSSLNGKKEEQIKIVTESMDVSQGKLILGLDAKFAETNFHEVAMVYNSILGDGATSKMFQNVREKAGLAYSASSIFIKQKRNIFIKCGIQIENYEKAVELIKIQLEDIRNGNFSDEDLENAKTYLISGIKNIEQEQDSEIVYYIGQELGKTNLSIQDYIGKISKVTKSEIIEFAKLVFINIIYFLKD